MQSKFKARIVQSRLEAEDVVSLTLRSIDGDDLPVWAAGAHIDIILPSGTVRQYSLCGNPEDRHHYKIAVLRQPKGRGGSLEVHDSLRVGQVVAIAGPRNAFAMKPAADYLFVAGGIGITPILAMVRQAARDAASFRLIYGGRSLDSLAFLDELQILAQGRLQVVPEDTHGRIDLDAIAAEAKKGSEVYACGPAGMLDALESLFASARLENELHVERFGAKPLVAQAGDGTTRLILKRKGTTLDVPPTISFLEALRGAGLDIDSSCEQGVCGTCETRVLDGLPDHRDSLLSEAERARNTCMMPCVSRALTPTLTLDL